jgi:hypothetical protein
VFGLPEAFIESFRISCMSWFWSNITKVMWLACLNFYHGPSRRTFTNQYHFRITHKHVHNLGITIDATTKIGRASAPKLEIILIIETIWAYNNISLMLLFTF